MLVFSPASVWRCSRDWWGNGDGGQNGLPSGRAVFAWAADCGLCADKWWWRGDEVGLGENWERSWENTSRPQLVQPWQIRKSSTPYSLRLLVSGCKKYFSNPSGPAHQIAKKHLSGNAIRQDYLETALKWICNRDEIEIAEYMAAHQHDATALELYISLISQSIYSPHYWDNDLYFRFRLF